MSGEQSRPEAGQFAGSVSPRVPASQVAAGEKQIAREDNVGGLKKQMTAPATSAGEMGTATATATVTEVGVEREDGIAMGKGKEKEIEQETEPATEHEEDLDSGYAWAILLIMFLLQSTISGSGRVYGVVYAKQVASGYYDREQASWPIATASAVENLAGILTPALAQFLTWRQIELLSSVLFILANLGAYLSNSLPCDILCLGVVQGLALSIATTLSLAINNDYFERYRTSAYGISMSGSTFGVLYLSPLVAWILETQGDGQFRLVYLALALVFCVNVVLVLFIKPRKKGVAPQGRGARLAGNAGAANGHVKTAATTSFPRSRKVSRLQYQLERTSSLASISVECKSRRESAWRRGNGAGCGGGGGSARIATIPTEQRQGDISISELAGKLTHHRVSMNRISTSSLSGKVAATTPTKTSHAATKQTSGGETRVDIIGADELTRAGDRQQQATENEFSAKIVIELLKSPYLHCVWMMLTIYYLISRVFIIILVDFADDHGLSFDDSRSLLNYWSLGELAGRIILGSFIDLRWLSVKSCITLTCSLLALFISLMVVISDYYLYAACSTLIAALVSLEYMLINVLMIEYIGKTKVTSCYSIAALISSLVLFARPTLIGLFRDKLGSYDGLLMLLAVITFAYAFLFILLEPLLVRLWPKCKQ